MSRVAQAHRLIMILLALSGALAILYTSVSIGLALFLAYRPPMPITQTPSSLGLQYRTVTFPSREDHLVLRGWFIPGILPDGRLTVERTIILVHGLHANREANQMLSLSSALAHHGFAVLAFDLRGHGESTPAPFGGGYFEQRDVLGAVDFLRFQPEPYPKLGRPHFIGGWGISSGGVALLFAAAQEPALQALVVDSAYASMESIIKHAFGVAFPFIPGTRVMAQILYGIDYYTVRPVDVVARIAPRPLLFIEGANDSIVPPSDMTELAIAAEAAPYAHVQTWLVPGAGHIQAYPASGHAYVQCLVAFYTAAWNSQARTGSLMIQACTGRESSK